MTTKEVGGKSEGTADTEFKARIEDVPEELTPEVVETPELIKSRSQLQKMEDNYKNEQRVSSKKEQEIRELRDKIDSMASDRELQQAFLAALAQNQGKSEEEVAEEVQTKKPDLLNQYKMMLAQQEATRKVTSYQRQVGELGLTSTGEDYWDIKDWVESGKYGRADARISKLKSLIGPKEEKKVEEAAKETEEERIDRLAEEKARKKLEAEGLLTTETGGPSASSQRKQDIIRRYGEGDPTVSTEEFEKVMGGRI